MPKAKQLKQQFLLLLFEASTRYFIIFFSSSSSPPLCVCFVCVCVYFTLSVRWDCILGIRIWCWSRAYCNPMILPFCCLLVYACIYVRRLFSFHFGIVIFKCFVEHDSSICVLLLLLLLQFTLHLFWILVSSVYCVGRRRGLFYFFSHYCVPWRVLCHAKQTNTYLFGTAQ